MTTNPEYTIDKKTGLVRQAGAELADGPFVNELRTAAEQSLYAFAKGILGLDQLTDRLHLPVCDILQDSEVSKIALLLPRDCLKTSMLKSLVLHALIQPADHNIYFPEGLGSTLKFDGCNTRILFAGENAKLAKRKVGWCRSQLSRNRLLRALWPHRVYEDTRQSPMWGNDGFTIPRSDIVDEPSVSPVGVDGASTGGHFHIIAIDDVATAAASKSATIMDQAIQWIQQSRDFWDDHLYSREINIGTRWAHWDPFAYYESNEPWNPQTGEGVFIYRRSAIENGESIFPEKLPLKVLYEKHRINPVSFSFQYMNDPMDASVVSFNISMLRDVQLGPISDVKDFGYIRATIDMTAKEMERYLAAEERHVFPPGGVKINDETAEWLFGQE